MAGNAMTDDDYLAALGLDSEIDTESFSERVSIKLEHLPNPTQKQIDAARDEAVLELS